MKGKRLVLFLLCFILTATSTVFGQTARKKFRLAGHVGYANMLGGTDGLTNSSSSYERELCSGFSWDAKVDVLVNSRIGIGVLYSGYTASGELDYSSDHIYTHYLAPQFTLTAWQSNRFKFYLNAGIGGIYYLNNSTVFGKERRVEGGNVAANIGGIVEYRINSSWGVSLNPQYISASLREIHATYHGETTRVIFGGEDKNRLDLSRLNLSAGMNFYF